MRISVVHSTVYRYDSPVYLEPHTFACAPARMRSQRLAVRDSRSRPHPPAQPQCLDQDGNVISPAPGSTASPGTRPCSTAFEIETLRDNPFDYLLAAQRSRDSRWSTPLPCAPRSRPTCAHDPLARHPRLRRIARRRMRLADHGLPLRAQPAASTPPPGRSSATKARLSRPKTTLRDQEGSCRDLAVLFCAACRAVGLAARFVSGYERDAVAARRTATCTPGPKSTWRAGLARLRPVARPRRRRVPRRRRRRQPTRCSPPPSPAPTAASATRHHGLLHFHAGGVKGRDAGCRSRGNDTSRIAPTQVRFSLRKASVELFPVAGSRRSARLDDARCVPPSPKRCR